MKFYTYGESNKPIILLIPGTCCHYSLFNNVIPLLIDRFYCVVASFDGFDENYPDSTYLSMEDETIQIERYTKDNFNNHISCIYGCSLGGSYASYLVQRNNIIVDHIILGSSDMDHDKPFIASIKGHIMAPIMYKMIHTQKLPRFMNKSLEKTKIKDPQRYEQMKLFIDSFLVTQLKDIVTKESIYNQFVSDLITTINDNIDNGHTKIHVFYALGMGKKYRARYLKHFKNVDIREQNMNHESFFFCYPKQWSELVKDCVFNN